MRPLDQIGRELGVDYVMEGSARREGARVRISATLIQVRDQTQRWTDSFDRELAGILAVQSDIARGVAGSLALTLLPDDQFRLANARPVNPDAYEAYLKGHFHAQNETPADLDLAKYFETALQKDHALEWLSKAVDARDPNVYGAFRDPLTNDTFRDDPRFQDLVRRTRLPI